MAALLLLAFTVLAAPQRQVLDAPAPAPLAVHGQLREGRENVAAALGVAVELRAAGQVLERADGRADEHGAFALDLPRPGAGATPTELLVVAWVEEPGYQRRATVARVAPGDAVATLQVFVLPGTTALLRVVDAAGRPALAEALDVQAFDTPTPAWRRGSGFGWSDLRARPHPRVRRGTGEVELRVGRAAEVWVLVRSDGVGAGVRRVSLDPARGDDAHEVVLEGSGVLEGTLQDPRGRPLPNVELLAFPGAWAGAPDEPADLAAVRGPPAELHGGGLVTCRATTDATGRFRFAGLRPGAYVVQDPRRARDALRLDLPRTPHATGGGPVALVARSHALEVTVLDADGVPVPGARPYRVALPQQVVRSWRQRDPGGDEVAPGTWRFEVEDGERYACGWFDAARGHVERVVAVGAEDFLQRLDLRLPAPAEPASVTLRVEDERGGPYRRQPWESVWAGVRSAESGVELDVADQGYDTATFERTVALPPGEYVAFLETGATPAMCGNGRTTPRLDHPPHERRFSVAPGEARTLVLRPPAGGHVRLHLRLPDDVRDPRLASEYLDDFDADWARRNDLLVLGDAGPCSRVWLLEPGGARQPLRFLFTESLRSSYGVHLIPGTRVRSFDPLPAGSVRLRVETPGFEPVERDVLIRARDVVETSVQLRYPGR